MVYRLLIVYLLLSNLSVMVCMFVFGLLLCFVWFCLGDLVCWVVCGLWLVITV